MDQTTEPGLEPAQRLRERLARYVAVANLWSILLAGAGGFVVIFALAELTAVLGSSLLIAPFGASCVLVFGLPRSPLSHPRNVIGGHLVSTAVGLLALSLLGATPIAFGIGVGLAIVVMLVTGTIHPPAGADPIVVILAGAGWSFLFLPVLAGAVAIVAAGLVFRSLVLPKTGPAEA